MLVIKSLKLSISRCDSTLDLPWAPCNTITKRTGILQYSMYLWTYSCVSIWEVSKHCLYYVFFQMNIWKNIHFLNITLGWVWFVGFYSQGQQPEKFISFIQLFFLDEYFLILVYVRTACDYLVARFWFDLVPLNVHV